MTTIYKLLKLLKWQQNFVFLYFHARNKTRPSLVYAMCLKNPGPVRRPLYSCT